MDTSQQTQAADTVMDAALIEAPDTAPDPDAGQSLETVELELALQFQDFVEHGFEGSVKRAVDSVGGRLLFQMRLDGAQDCDRVAAVAMRTGEAEKFALIVLPSDGGAPRGEPAETSSNPLAGIAAAYAGLMDQLGAAA